MVFLILAVCIMVIIITAVGFEKDYLNGEAFVPITMVSALVLLVSFIAAIVLGVNVTRLNVIDDRIAMYEEENTKIEAQIDTVVKTYQEYESEIFTNVTPDSSITLVSLYPELKADTLVQSQIEVYIKNNETIKELKEQKISGSVIRWWLYFGG